LREREKYIQVNEEVDDLVQIVDISENMEQAIVTITEIVHKIVTKSLID
jgi:hypothetical protein